MATKKVRLLTNVGWQDANGLGLHDLTAEELAEGKTIDVDEIQFDKMVNRMKIAVADDGTRAKGGKAKTTARDKFGQITPPPMGDDEHLEDVEEEEGPTEAGGQSPVANDDARTAIDHISRMHSAEKLQSIVDYDQRTTVQEAAKRRLGEL